MPINKIAYTSIEENQQNYINVLRAGQSINDIGWRIYNDGDSNVPIDGIDGTTNITWSQNTDNPLSGESDLRLVKSGNTSRRGQGVSIDFTISNRHLAKVLQITLDSELISGTFVSHDIKFYIIANPGTSNILIEPVNTGLQLGVSNPRQRIRHIASFQTDISITSYRLCIHIASTSTSDYTIDFANFKIWEPNQSIGSVITDWVSYTPSSSISNATTSFKYKRSGSDIMINCSMYWTGTGITTFTPSQILPSGLSIDTSKLALSVTNTRASVGFGNHTDSGVSNYSVNYIYDSNNTIFPLPNSPIPTPGSGDSTHIEFIMPILGWGSNVAMSSDTGDGRIVAARYTNPTTSGSVLVYQTRDYDTHGAYSNGVFTAPVNGYYRFSATIRGVFNSQWAVQIDEVTYTGAILDMSTGGYSLPLTDTVFLRANQKLRIIFSAGSLSNAITSHAFAIERISAGSQIIATQETVACEVWTNTNTPGSATTNFIFNQIIRDTHGSWNITTGIYTAPMNGWYNLSMYYPPTTNANNNLHIYKAPVGGSFSIYKIIISNASISINNTVSGGVFYLLSGEQISVRPSASISLFGTTTLAGNSSWLSINRIGI